MSGFLIWVAVLLIIFLVVKQLILPNIVAALGGNACTHEWGDVKDGIQFCMLCNKAKSIPCPHQWGPATEGEQSCLRCNIRRKMPCEHEWELEDTNQVTGPTGNVIRIIKTLKCKHCGDLKQSTIDSGR